MTGWSGVSPRQWAKRTEQKLDLVFKKISLEMFSRVIMRSPVDEGRFLGNWQVAIGSVPTGTLEINDTDGTATVSKATAVAMQVSVGDVIVLANNLPYAQKLEMGSSSQAPSGMVALTVQEFQAVVKQAGIEVRYA